MAADLEALRNLGAEDMQRQSEAHRRLCTDLEERFARDAAAAAATAANAAAAQQVSLGRLATCWLGAPLSAPMALCVVSCTFSSAMAVPVAKHDNTAHNFFSSWQSQAASLVLAPFPKSAHCKRVTWRNDPAPKHTVIGSCVAIQAAAAAAAAAADGRVAQLRGALQSVTSEFRAEVVALEEAASLERRSHTHRLATALAEARQQAAAAADAAAEVGAPHASFPPMCTEPELSRPVCNSCSAPARQSQACRPQAYQSQFLSSHIIASSETSGQSLSFQNEFWPSSAEIEVCFLGVAVRTIAWCRTVSTCICNNCQLGYAHVTLQVHEAELTAANERHAAEAAAAASAHAAAEKQSGEWFAQQAAEAQRALAEKEQAEAQLHQLREQTTRQLRVAEDSSQVRGGGLPGHAGLELADRTPAVHDQKW